MAARRRSRTKNKSRRKARKDANLKAKHLARYAQASLLPDFQECTVVINGNPQEHKHSITIAAKLKGSGSSLDAIIKETVGHKDSTGPMQSLFYLPSFIHTQEYLNLKAWNDIIGGGHVPELYGRDEQRFILTMEKAVGETRRARIVRAVRKLAENPDSKTAKTALNNEVFGLVRQVAQFDGVGNYKAKKLLAAFPHYNEQTTQTLIKASQEVHKEALMKVSRTTDDPNGALQEIWGYLPFFETRSIFAHGDFDSNHAVVLSGGGEMTIDLERFGPGYPMETDLGAALIVKKIGHNYLVERKNFGRLLHAYLAYEHAFETGDMDAVLRLDTKKDFKKYLDESKDFSPEILSNFKLAVYRALIQKNVALAARYKESSRRVAMATQHNKLLFSEVASLDDDFDRATNGEMLRKCFRSMADLQTRYRVVTLDETVMDAIYTKPEIQDQGKATQEM